MNCKKYQSIIVIIFLPQVFSICFGLLKRTVSLNLKYVPYLGSGLRKTGHLLQGHGLAHTRVLMIQTEVHYLEK